MAEKKITNSTELNSAVALTTNHLYNICNSKDINDIIVSFSEAKDYLIAIYKYNVEKLTQKGNSK